MEEEIKTRVTQKHTEKHFQEDKEFRKRAAIYRYAVSIGFGILEDIPQLAIQTLNTILIGRTMKWIQVLSPLSSTVSIFMRFYNIRMQDIFPDEDDSEANRTDQI